MYLLLRLKDGVQIKSTTSERISITCEEGSNVYKLSIQETVAEDEGVYSFVATNKEGETTGDIKLSVHSEAPTFSTKPKSCYARAGQTTKFEGCVQGIPLPVISWQKADEVIVESERFKMESADDGTFSLTISDVQETDYAEYTAKATSAVGENSSTAELTLTSEPPTLLGDKLPFATKVNEGEPLKLTLKVGGSPLPDVKWYKDGKELIPDERTTITLLPDGTAQLEIASADSATDSGQYKMVAVNPTGEVSSETAVDVKKVPKKGTIDEALPDGVTAVEGEPLKLTARVSGHPKPEIKWMKDGRPIRPGSNNAILSHLPDGTVTLEIESAKLEDAGKYSLSVVNDLGESECETAVEIQQAPSAPLFVSPLFAVKGTEGFPVRMEAKCKGFPFPAITWMKDGKKLKHFAGDASKKPEADGTVRLSLVSADPSDAGEYTAVARNSFGEAKSSAKMDVRPRKSDGPEAAAAVLSGPRDTVVDEGSALKLSAVIGGNPIPDVIWTLNGEPIDESRCLVTIDGDKITLEVEKADKKIDEGEYEIGVSNELGVAEAKAKVAVKKIFSAPSFVQKFSDMQQLPGYDCKFMAKISGLPKPTVAWTFDGEPISESEKYKIKRDGDMCVLFVRDCAADRAGRYACILTNAEGEASCEAQLEVVDKIEKKEKEEAPHFLKRIGDIEIYEGMTAKFTACASGFPEPEHEWFRNGQKLTAGGRVKMEKEGNGLLRLTIKFVEEADVGEYSLRVFNRSGEATCSAELSFDTLDSRPKKPVGDQYADFDKFRNSGAPVPLPDRPIIHLIHDRYVTLSWKPSVPIGPRIPVTYHVEMCECPDGDWQKVKLNEMITKIRISCLFLFFFCFIRFDQESKDVAVTSAIWIRIVITVSAFV